MQNRDDGFEAFLICVISSSKCFLLQKTESELQIGFGKHCLSFSIDYRLVLVIFSIAACLAKENSHYTGKEILESL